MWSSKKYIKEWYDVHVFNQISFSSYEALVLDHEQDQGDEVIEDYIEDSCEEEEKSNKGNQASISSSIEDNEGTQASVSSSIEC